MVAFCFILQGEWLDKNEGIWQINGEIWFSYTIKIGIDGLLYFGSEDNNLWTMQLLEQIREVSTVGLGGFTIERHWNKFKIFYNRI